MHAPPLSCAALSYAVSVLFHDGRVTLWTSSLQRADAVASLALLPVHSVTSCVLLFKPALHNSPTFDYSCHSACCMHRDFTISAWAFNAPHPAIATVRFHYTGVCTAWSFACTLFMHARIRHHHDVRNFFASDRSMHAMVAFGCGLAGTPGCTGLLAG